MASLIVEKGPQEGMIYELIKDITYIGRDPSCDIFFPDRKMSRLHCTISKNKNGEYLLRDLESKNGTLVNGMLVKSITLNDGDVIEIGDTILVFEKEEKEGGNGTSLNEISNIVTNKEWGKTKTLLKADEESYINLPRKVSTEDLKIAYDRLVKLSKISEKLTQIENEMALYKKLCDIIFEQFEPDYVYVFKVEGQNKLSIVAKKERKELSKKHRQISRSILRDCLKKKVGILITDAKHDQRYSATSSVILSAVRSAICVPVIVNDKVVAIIYVDTLSPLRSFNKLDLQLLTGIAVQISMSLKNIFMHQEAVRRSSYESELSIARKIQQKFLPKKVPEIENYEIAFYSEPTRIVGGDYFDFIKKEKKLALFIGDVSGKGLPSAIMMASLRAYVKSEVNHCDIVEQIVYNLNNYVWYDMQGSMYVTFFMGYLDFETNVLEYVNAGHCYPLILKENGEIKELKEGGFYLGMQPNSKYQKGKIQIEKNDLIILYTDGITDQLNEHKGIFGKERLFETLLENKDKPPQQIIEATISEIFDFMQGEELFDDMTIIVMKRKK